MNIVQLGQLALERANTSRLAVQVMGELAEAWGYADGARPSSLYGRSFSICVSLISGTFFCSAQRPSRC
jgi:hypothetical protein